MLRGAREGRGPAWLQARCIRADGHFLNDPMLRMAHSPIEEGGDTFKKVMSATVTLGGGGLASRAASVVNMLDLLRRVRKEGRDSAADPLVKARKRLKRAGGEVARIDEAAAAEMAEAAGPALAEGPLGPLAALPLGQAVRRRPGSDLTICSLAVGVHRALVAAERLAERGVDCEVIDLRTVRPLDSEPVARSVERSGRLLLVDEDYREFGLSGELAACLLERGLAPRFARVCLEGTLPYDRRREERALPNVARIVEAAAQLTR